MQPLLTRDQMRLADRQATEVFGLPEILLMEHAGLALVSALTRRFGTWLKHSRGLVIAGKGNNGGDVIAAARCLVAQGCHQVFTVVLADEASLSELGRTQLSLLRKQGLSWGRELGPERFEKVDWILDGIVGTGLCGPLDTTTRKNVELMNAFSAGKWVVSADLPSGLDGNTGKPLGAAVKASETVALGFLKRGLTTGDAAEYVGRLSLATIQIPRTVPSAGWDTFLYTAEDAAKHLPERKKSSHKGSFGHVSVIAGNSDKEGAPALAAIGALRAGAGLVTVHAPNETLLTLRPRLRAEIQTETLEVSALALLPPRVLVIGPGLGTSENQWEQLSLLLTTKHVLVLDADALNLLSAHSADAKALLKQREPNTTVLTPHPKEASRLLGNSVEEIENDRFQSCSQIAQEWNAFVGLKGAGTLCSGPGAPLVVVQAGDSGLSKGGTGDVLAGMVGALLAQGLPANEALPLSVYLHGRSSELVTRRNGHSRSTLASEVADGIVEVLKELECRGS
jgi:ADP-dependent NAD(P)H-hydrate dehydratase / NAD(P)H-hydrate epimerase